MYILIPPSVREFCEQIDWPINTFSNHRSSTQTFNQFIICLLWYRCDCGLVSRCKKEIRSHSLTGLSAVSKKMAFLSSIRCTNSWNRLYPRKTLTPCVYSGHMATKSKILWHLQIIYLIVRLIKLTHFMFCKEQWCEHGCQQLHQVSPE